MISGNLLSPTSCQLFERIILTNSICIIINILIFFRTTIIFIWDIYITFYNKILYTEYDNTAILNNMVFSIKNSIYLQNI